MEKALLDLLRVGLTGDTAGVRQLGRRLIRKSPGEVGDIEGFRQAVGAVLNATPATGITFRSAPELPSDTESQLPLVRTEQPSVENPPVFAAPVYEVIDRLIRERGMADVLLDAGLQPTKTLLISGPPGVGKTLTAQFVASRLELPLVSVDLATLMSSFLGRTGQNLRNALNFGQSTPCVFLLDEFDALAKRRDDEADVGELKRLVNILLLELDRWPDNNLLIAATNHPELLDAAIHRRFDLTLRLPLPGAQERFEILTNLVKGLRLSEELDEEFLLLYAKLTEGTSAADVVRLAQGAARTSLVESQPIALTLLRGMLSTASETHLGGDARDMLCGLARRSLGMSDRQIAGFLGISHPTVAKAAARWSQKQEQHV